MAWYLINKPGFGIMMPKNIFKYYEENDKVF